MLSRRVLKSLGELLIRIALVFIIIAFTASEMAFAKTDIDYWATTGISQTHLKNFFTQERCYKSENSFVGCIQAINTLLAYSTPTKILTNNQINHIAGAQDTVKLVQGLEIKNYKAQEFQDDPNIAWNKIKENRLKVDRSWRDLYISTRKKIMQLDMGKIVSVAFSLAKREGTQNTIAESLNAYFISAIDPHTHINPQSEIDALAKNADDNFVGIGCTMRQMGKRVLMEPLEEGPALKSGVKYMDVLTHIDGKPIAGLQLSEAVKQIRGAENTSVTLTVVRGAKTLNIAIVRHKITIPTISAEIFSNPATNTNVGYIKINSFMESGLCQKFANFASHLKEIGAQSLVLDLRNNSGGRVEEVLCMAALYVDGDKTLLVHQDPQTNAVLGEAINSSHVASALYNLFEKKPLVVLLNAASASASELLPGALRAYGRVVTVGEQSFGKGTMQTSAPPETLGLSGATGVVLFKTFSRFHFADGSSNQLSGISPDFLAYAKPNPSALEKFAMREADLYTNAISASQPTHGISIAAKAQISQCIKKRNLVEQQYSSSSRPDYQLIIAREVAACL